MVAKTVTKTVEITNGDGIESEDAPPEKLEDDVIRALTELEGADEVRWQVHRVSQPNPGYCSPELSTAELTLQRISTDHGPGRYKIRGLKQNGQYFRSATVTIADVAKQKDATIDILTALKEKNNGGDDRMFTLLMGMMQQNSAVITAALTKPQSDFPWPALLSASPLLITALKDVFKNTSSDDAMEKLLKQLTLVEKLRGDDKKEGSSWTDIIRDALPALQSMVSRSGAAHGIGAAPSAVQPVAARVIAGTQQSLSVADHSETDAVRSTDIETPEAVEPTIEMMGMNWIKAKLEELIANAAQNKNPELRAEVFVDDLPAYVPESLIVEMLSRDDWFEQLSKFDPRVISYHGWFSELRDCILETFQPDGEEPKNDSPPAH